MRQPPRGPVPQPKQHPRGGTWMPPSYQPGRAWKPMETWNYERVQMMLPPEIRQKNPIYHIPRQTYSERWGPPDLTKSPKVRPAEIPAPTAQGEPGDWSFYNLDKAKAQRAERYQREFNWGDTTGLSPAWQAGSERAGNMMALAHQQIWEHAAKGEGMTWRRPWHSLGQWKIDSLGSDAWYQPGRVLSAVGWGIWNFISMGTEGVEQVLNYNYYNTEQLPLRKTLGVDKNPYGEDAYRAALTVGWSGPQAVANAYHDASYLAAQGLLTPENIELIQARHGDPIKEFAGHTIADPMWALDIASGGLEMAKRARSARWFRGANKLFIEPATDVAGVLKPASQITKELVTGAHRAQQVANAETLTGRLINYTFPRLKSTYAHIEATRMAQVIELGSGVTEKSAHLDAILQGLDPKSVEYAKFVEVRSAENLQTLAALLVETATDNQDEIYRAAKELDKMGFGTVGVSKMGRQTGVVLRQIMQRPNGELGDLHQIIELAKSEGKTAEHVASAFYTKVQDVLMKIVETPSHDVAAMQVIAKKTPVIGTGTKFRRAADEFYGSLLLGVNPGYAMRNLYDNLAHTIANGLSPFTTYPEFWKEMGYTPVVRGRGIGQAGEQLSRALPATKAAEWTEKQFSKVNYDQPYMTAYKELMDAALESMRGTLNETTIKAIRNRMYGGIDNIEALGEHSVVLDAWKELDPVLFEAMHKINPGLAAHVQESIGKAETIEKALAHIDLMREQVIRLLETNTNAAKDIGTVAGTVHGQAIRAAAESEAFALKDLNDLARILSGREHAIDVSRNRALISAARQFRPQDSYAFLKMVEERYAETVSHLSRRQMVDYARLVAGQITQKEFVDGLITQYNKAYYALDRAYSEIIHLEPGRETIQTLTGKNARVILNWALGREAALAGLGTAEEVSTLSKVKEGYKPMTEFLDAHSWVESVAARPDSHFMNKVRQLMSRYGIYPEGTKNPTEYLRNLKYKDLTTDDLVDIINAFRRERGAVKDAGELPGQLTQAMKRELIDWAEGAAKQALPNYRNHLDDIRFVRDLRDNELEVVRKAGLLEEEAKAVDMEKVRQALIDWTEGQPSYHDHVNRFYKTLDDLNAEELEQIEKVGLLKKAPTGEEVDIMRLAEEYNNMLTPEEALKHPMLQLFRQVEKRPHGVADTNNMRQLMRWQLDREALLSGWVPGDVHELPAQLEELTEAPKFLDVIADALAGAYTQGGDVDELASVANYMQGINSVDDLDEPQLMYVINYLRRGREAKPLKIMDVFENYANMPTSGLSEGYTRGLHGAVPLDVDLKLLDDIIDSATDPKLSEAALAARSALVGRVAPSPSLATSSFEQAAREMEMLDGIREFLLQNSGSKRVPGIPQHIMQQLRTLWVNSHMVAGEVAKRSRNLTLLDYRDRRTIDSLLKMVFPWHYWWSRSLPNWAWTMATNPRLTAHWMRLNEEIREYNNNDPNVPEWAKGYVVMKNPGGYPGRLMWDHQAAFNAVGTIFDTFDDEDRQKDALGKLLSTSDKLGPAPHPMLIAAYAAERWFLHRDEAAARSMGYLAPATRAYSALTGQTLEPWLWTTDEEGNRIPLVGGTKWDIEKTNRMMAARQKAGEIPAEQAMLETAQRGGPAFEDTMMNRIVSGYRTIPVIASSILGLRVTPRQDWEMQLAADQQSYYDAKERGGQAAANDVLVEKPWLSTYWMSWDNEATRMKFLADNVLNQRLPPMSKKDRQALLEKVGLPEELVNKFYEDTRGGNKTGLTTWDKKDYNAFVSGVLDLANMFALPDKQTAREWRIARKEYSTLWDRLEHKFPTGENDQEIYYALLENQGEEAANEFKAHSSLPAYWEYKNREMIKYPYILKYYGDTMDVDMAVNSLVDDELVRLYGPDIFLLRQQAKDIEDWRDRREFNRLYPQVDDSYDAQEQLLKQYQRNYTTLRQLSHAGQEARIPQEQENFENLNSRQRAVAKAVDEMKLEASLKAKPPREWEKKYTPEQEELFTARDEIYAEVVKQYPNYYQQYKEYERIKYVYGDEAAKVYGKESGYFDARSYETLLTAQNPTTLKEMDDTDIEYAASALKNQHAEQMWPGIWDSWTAYHALPKGAERKAYWKEHPELGAYMDWSDGAEEYYIDQIKRQRTALRQLRTAKEQVSSPAVEQRGRVGGLESPLNLEALADAIGQAESGGNYTAKNPNSSASGKYQYITATWNNYGGYATAAEAPAEVQDEKMVMDLKARAAKYGNDLDRVIASHYYPAWANDPDKWDQSPTPGQPTIRQYIESIKRFLEETQ